MVVHACIDGFSRVPVYLHCSNNNRTNTVLNLFKEAIDEWGLPSRVRCDQGGENTDVACYVVPSQARNKKRVSHCWKKCPQSNS